MKKGLLLLLCLAGLEAGASVVKITSYFCKDVNNPARHRKGSGVVVKRSGKHYVVTSGHVPLHGPRDAKPGEICQVVKHEDGSTYEGSLVAANFLKDLALLEITDGKNASSNK